MQKPVTAELLNTYLNDNCSPAEEAIVKNWYNAFACDDNHVSALSSIQKNTLKTRMKKAIDKQIQLLQKTIPPAGKVTFFVTMLPAAKH